MKVASRRLRLSQPSSTETRACRLSLTASTLQILFQHPAVGGQPGAAEHEVKTEMEAVSRPLRSRDAERREFVPFEGPHQVDHRVERQIDDQRGDDHEKN